jgi:hypothetical protein
MELTDVISGRGAIRNYIVEPTQQGHSTYASMGSSEGASAINSHPWAYVKTQDKGDRKRHSDGTKLCCAQAFAVQSGHVELM